MNRVAITIVDVMAFLIPGVVLLFGFVLVPFPDDWLAPLRDVICARVPLLTNSWVAGGCWVVAAYLLGFLLRLVSMDLLSSITWRRWSNRVHQRSNTLSAALEEAIGNPVVVDALRSIADASADHAVGKWAPYFQFAKRSLRLRHELWVEAERLEAEIRLMAGLFIPCVILAIAGGLRMPLHFRSATLLIAAGALGALTVYLRFPERRVKETVYVQLLALVALRRPTVNGNPD